MGLTRTEIFGASSLFYPKIQILVHGFGWPKWIEVIKKARIISHEILVKNVDFKNRYCEKPVIKLYPTDLEMAIN